ncbi:cytochrome P450 [Cladochytrium replicatum]|nr:cytochrome P450 [Cladochytrium replicatum]
MLTVAIITAVIGASLLFVLNYKAPPFSDPPVKRVGFFRALYFNLIGGKSFPERQDGIRRHLSKEDIKIYEDWIGPIRCLALCTPDAIRTQFDNKRFPKLDFGNSRLIGFKSTITYYLFGENVASTVGEEYQMHRSVTRPAFAKPFRVPAFVNCVSKLILILSIHNKHHADVPLNVYPFMQRLTLDVLGAAMLSFSFKSLELQDNITNANELKPGHYVDIWNQLMESALKPINVVIPYFSKLPLERNKRAWRVAREFRGMMEKIVDERFAVRRESMAIGVLDEKKDTDLVDLMVEAVENDVNGQKWTRKEIVDNIGVFFHDTTANALAAAFYLLAANPTEQDKLREEVTRVFGKPTLLSEALLENVDLSTFSQQLAHCSYVNAVIKEAMRLYPSAPITGLRVASEDTPIRVPMPDGSIRNFTIKEGAIVRANIMDMHYDPNVFPDPTRFIPERWLKKGGGLVDESADATATASGWMPFGSGLRMCMGIQMSLLEQRVVLAMMIRAFRVELSEETRKDGYVFGPANLLRPVGMKLFFRPLVE